jgi:hypothetical protein
VEPLKRIQATRPAPSAPAPEQNQVEPDIEDTLPPSCRRCPSRCTSGWECARSCSIARSCPARNTSFTAPIDSDPRWHLVFRLLPADTGPHDLQGVGSPKPAGRGR